ncbi:MAG: hypothetical protein C0459_00025 [Chitinophaga sp.]|jgi:TonB-dependent starch-binding outer membrane protein SusC|nr:hypothetical protein [Chitinophaga sp.]
MRKLLFLLATALLLGGVGLAQTMRTLTGKVTDAKGAAISNATVTVKGSTVGTTTDADGAFTIKVPATAKVLAISSLNFNTYEVAIGNKTNFTVTLESATQNLEEVVVVGYGTQKKKNVTASVSSIGSEKVENKPFAAVDQMLQGAAPGLQATSATGQPGAVTAVRIRGVGSFSYSGSRPLYVVDGVQINDGDLSNGNGGGFSINPSTNVLATMNSDDIESITVLKDAAATSIYGSRGANGVIVITTKSGKVGKTQFKFDAEVGTNNVILPPAAGLPLRAANWFSLLQEGLVNAGASPAAITTTLNNYGYGNGVDVDWFGLITRPGTQQQYNLTASGGDAKTKFFLSGGYFKQQGTTLGADLSRLTGTLKVTHNATDKLSFTTKITIGNVIQNSVLASDGPGGGGGYFGNPAYVAMVLRPTQNPFNADGTYNIGTDNLSFPAHYNPLYIAANDKRWLKAFNGLGNETVEYKILKDLKFSSNLGLQYNINEEYQYNNPFHGDGSGSSGEGISITTRNFLWDWINQFDYHYNISKNGKFYLDAKAGYEAIKNNRYQQIGDVTGFPPKVDLYYSTNAATSTNGKATAADYTFQGYYGNLNLSYYDRYTLYGSFRRDASSRFGINNPWGNFWSVGAAWSITNEKFFNVKEISNLKIHASYGTNGNAEIGNYTWRPTFGYGANYNGVAGGTFNNIGNIDLTWEKNKQLDFGVNLGLFKNRINVTADWYKRSTDGALLNQQISRTTGFTGFINNVGSLENKGFELSVNVIPVQTKSFSWEVNFSYSHNKNAVTALPAGDQLNGSYMLRVGQDYYSFYTRAWAGVNPDDGSPLWYGDSTKSSTVATIGAAKQFIVGKSAAPSSFGTLGNTITYKGFSLSFDLYYNYGNWFQEGYYRFFMDGFSPTRGKYSYVLNRWQKKGDITDVPKYIYGSSNNSYTGSDRLLFKGDYVRLRNVQIGYRLTDKAILNKAHLTGLYFYVRGTNLWTKTYADNLLSDPEQGIIGVNNQQVLPSKSVTVGLNVSF